ncbi:MAG: thiopeptide-type bacteriocin biosynthesis protein, partial [Pseudonocardiaceae bacterium]
MNTDTTKAAPPAWRLRYQSVNPDTKAVGTLLSELEADGHLARWTRGIYEPETLAFGGPAAIDIAHSLFHHDSRHCLARATKPAALGQREITVLLFSAMLRAATPTAPVSPAPIRPPSPRWPSTPFSTARLPGRHQPGPPPTPLAGLSGPAVTLESTVRCESTPQRWPGACRCCTPCTTGTQMPAV